MIPWNKGLSFYTLVFILIVSSIPSVFSSGAREDWSDKYDNLPGAPECWMDGYDDGLDHPFDGDRRRECIFDVQPSESDLCCNGKPYYEGFMYSCIDVEGNTQETCERKID